MTTDHLTSPYGVVLQNPTLTPTFQQLHYEKQAFIYYYPISTVDFKYDIRLSQFPLGKNK